MITGELNEDQMNRIRQAHELGKYGLLETWQELFVYQQVCNNPGQLREISEWARRKNNGENIKLPLKDNSKDVQEKF